MLPCFIKPFTYWQIKNILSNDYWIELQDINDYKYARYGRKKRYVLVYEQTGELAFQDYVTLDSLREYLTLQGYTLDYK